MHTHTGEENSRDWGVRRKDLRTGAGHGPAGPWSSCGEGVSSSISPRRTVPFPLPQRPQSQHPLSPGNFPPLPLKTQTGGSTTLAYLCLCRLHVRALSPSAPPAPSTGPGQLHVSPKRHHLTFGENCPLIPLCFPGPPHHPEPSGNLFPSFCLSLLQESNFLCTLRARHLL